MWACNKGVSSTQSVDIDSAHFTDYIDNKRMDALIQKYEWSLLSVTDHVAAYDQLISQYSAFLSLATKKVKLRSRNPHKKWITRPILELAHEKDGLWKRCKNNPCDLLLEQEYRIIRNRLTDKLRLNKKQYFVAEFGKCRNNMRKTWGLINDLMDKPRQKNLDDSLMNTFAPEHPLTIANTFKETFEASLEKLKEKSSVVSDLSYIGPTLEFCLPAVSRWK